MVDDASTGAPCQKKFIRDMRAFIGGCSSHTMRSIPVGVVMADPDTTQNNRQLNAQYYNCRTDSSDKYGGGTRAGGTGSTPSHGGQVRAQRTWRQAGWLLGDDFPQGILRRLRLRYSTEMANSDGSGSSASAYPFTSYGAQNYSRATTRPGTATGSAFLVLVQPDAELLQPFDALQ
ncbi:ATP-binding Cassette (ABC) Superfamily [Phytophthora cinnamomi]|uniref:ATP-binding Cassette (ABC) Superfamily n=1 Tax=Phytophthora cinnamomi TaxID=4785 RepID=UPI00355A5704|nr:ATP-binding Cassette (ABC) Superfamily [Phytophthora cinnamomi]